MSEFRNKLKALDDDALADLVADVAAERKRREPMKDPASMSQADYMRWVDDEITKTQRAKAEAAEAAKEQR